MNLPERDGPVDPFSELLAAYDDALASGQVPSPAEETSTSVDLLPRLKRAQSCLWHLETVWPRSGLPSDAGPPDEVSADVVLRRLRNPPARLGKFQVRGAVPDPGPWALVLLGYHPDRERTVLLKVPRPEDFNTPERRWRFLREVKAVAALDHPNLVPVYQAGVVGAVCYVVSANREGPTLAEWLRGQDAPVPVRRAAALVGVLAGAVHHAHGRGVVHRRLEPGNVLIGHGHGSPSGARGRPRLPGGAPESAARSRSQDLGPWAADLGGLVPMIPDFGLARLLKPDEQGGVPAGAPCYLAPEQADGRWHEVGPRTDVHALGAILYELLTGRPPFRGATDEETLRQVARRWAVRPRVLRREVPRALETVVLKCLEKEPRHRYPSALALADDLRSFLNAQPTWARPVGFARRWWRRWRYRQARATSGKSA